MAKVTHLAKAPIAEALIDIRIEPLFLPLKHNPLDNIRKELASSYPKVSEIHNTSIQIEVKANQSNADAQHHDRKIGIALSTQDGLNVVQLRENGFTFNRLKPYTSWDEIFPEALRIWKLYSSSLKRSEIKRLAVRYINQMLFDKKNFGISDYFTAVPGLPEGAPRNVSAFTSMIVVHDAKTGAAANLGTMMQSGPEGAVLLGIDIDAFIMVNQQSSQSDLAGQFEILRSLKNDIFFSSITEKALENYR